LEKWICTETGLYGNESDEVLDIIKGIKENFEAIKYKEPFLEKNQYFIEPFFNNDNVCILGAGHVGKVLAEFCKILGFYVVVVDDRQEFANLKRFKTADEIIVVPSFDSLTDHVKINQFSYVIIVTRGHTYDKEVIRQMLLTEAKYIGMIGGKSKWDYLRKCLLEEGFTSAQLQRIHSPIGLLIHGKTTEEIAVSIVAEMISVRRAPKMHEN
ncbi:MAG: XdhC family protein, partial [Acetobacterium sp.]